MIPRKASRRLCGSEIDNGHLCRVVLVRPEGRVDVRRACQPSENPAGPPEEDHRKVLHPVRLGTLDEDVPVADPHDELHGDEIGREQKEVGYEQQSFREQHQAECGKPAASVFVVHRDDEVNGVCALGHFHLDRWYSLNSSVSILLVEFPIRR